ncbi:Na+/H+ antiporter NhaA [Halpernia sp.]|uniref:Na+/H+ antiporter NhaA n=1 Tax=Halpernia sp. TaxID=2782209 RepID=UPI003A8CCD3A
MILTNYFKKFFTSSEASGVLLIICVIISLFIANSSASDGFNNFLHTYIGLESINLKFSVSHWINDGLMAVFFLLVGLEIKREIVEGELSTIKSASLPIFAAVGGMIIPALIYIFFNHSNAYAKGWAIPMATDIAFSLAIVGMLGKAVPASIKIFLAALAIVDDLGAILIIAFFYTDSLHWINLGICLLIVVILILLNFFKFKNYFYYLIPGVFLWYFMIHSGIHATIAGVILAFTIPTNISKDIPSPLEKLESKLHVPVSFFIMPIFALTNTNITFHTGMIDGLFTNFGAGIILGLVLGKIVGINLFSWIAIKLGLSELPYKSRWNQMIGVGLLAGIGFTMSIFIALLSFKGHPNIQDEAKFAILAASLISGFSGYLLLKYSKQKKMFLSNYRKKYHKKF